ncbi:MAG: hypothetical protein ACLFPE_06365 [Bacteroidales bacterium]
MTHSKCELLSAARPALSAAPAGSFQQAVDTLLPRFTQPDFLYLRPVPR